MQACAPKRLPASLAEVVTVRRSKNKHGSGLNSKVRWNLAIDLHLPIWILSSPCTVVLEIPWRELPYCFRGPWCSRACSVYVRCVGLLALICSQALCVMVVVGHVFWGIPVYSFHIWQACHGCSLSIASACSLIGSRWVTSGIMCSAGSRCCWESHAGSPFVYVPRLTHLIRTWQLNCWREQYMTKLMT